MREHSWDLEFWFMKLLFGRAMETEEKGEML